MLDLIGRSIGERVTVQTRFAEQPWRVWADPNLLENAILNLCVNARDAMEGEGRLGILIDNVALGQGEVGDLDAGDSIRISVSDTGHGIPSEYLDRSSEEHTSELQSLMRSSYAVFCLKKKITKTQAHN